MGVKALRVIGFLALGAAIAVTGSCKFLGITMTERITTFLDDLNSNRDLVSRNFDHTTTDPLAPFPAPASGEQQYSVTGLDTLDPLNVTAVVYGPPSGTPPFDPTGSGIPIRFVMVQVNADWFIQQIYLNNSATPAVQ